MNSWIKIYLTALTIALAFIIVSPANAATEQGICNCGTEGSGASTKAQCDAAIQGGFKCTWTAIMLGDSFDFGKNDSFDMGKNASAGKTVTLENPLGETDVRVLIGRVIRVALGFVGSLALIIVVYGGLTWMTSYGNADRVKSGRDTLLWAAIGLVVILSSYVIVNFLFTGITGGTG